jgi:ribonucleotide monophosphatase NagD (HAD superfamily)
LDGQKTRVEPIVVGKPNKLFGELVLEASGLSHINPSRVLMIGDKIETDIRLAKNCGFKSCLVLSGCSTERELHNIAPDDKPDYVFAGLLELFEREKEQS